MAAARTRASFPVNSWHMTCCSNIVRVISYVKPRFPGQFHELVCYAAVSSYHGYVRFNTRVSVSYT